MAKITIATMEKVETPTSYELKSLFYNPVENTFLKVSYMRFDFSYYGRELSNLRLVDVHPTFQNYIIETKIYENINDNIKAAVTLEARSKIVPIIAGNTFIAPWATFKFDRSIANEPIAYGVDGFESYIATEVESQIYV